MTEHIPVFLASNDLYAPFVATTIISILEHTKSFIDFYILTDGISDENQRKIGRLKEKYSNWSIEYLYIDNEKLLKDFPDLEYYTLACYNRYFISLLKPNLDKIIYSDVDVIYRDDIKKMYDIDLGKYGLAAPIEEIGEEFPGNLNYCVRNKNLEIDESHSWFQSGNLILSLNYWRKNKIMEKCIENTLKYKEFLVCPDLDVLNKLFANNYYRLDYKYSVCTHRIGHEAGNTEMLEALKNPFCIHYASSHKPWNTKNVPLSDYFWEIARKTPFYEDILNWYATSTSASEFAKLANYESIQKKYRRHKLYVHLSFGDKRKHHMEQRDKLKKELKRIKNKLTR